MELSTTPTLRHPRVAITNEQGNNLFASGGMRVNPRSTKQMVGPSMVPISTTTIPFVQQPYTQVNIVESGGTRVTRDGPLQTIEVPTRLPPPNDEPYKYGIPSQQLEPVVGGRRTGYMPPYNPPAVQSVPAAPITFPPTFSKFTSPVTPDPNTIERTIDSKLIIRPYLINPIPIQKTSNSGVIPSPTPPIPPIPPGP
jgi:hypothetical protein